MDKASMNISSLVIKALPGKAESVLASLRASGLCDIHFHDEQGRIVATIEGRDIEEEMEKLKAIQGLPSVVAAHLVYAYSDDVLAQDIGRMMPSGRVPEQLREQ